MNTDFYLTMPVDKEMWCVGAGVPVKTVPIVGVELLKLPQYSKVWVMAESVIGDEPFAVLLGDDWIDSNAKCSYS